LHSFLSNMILYQKSIVKETIIPNIQLYSVVVDLIDAVLVGISRIYSMVVSKDVRSDKICFCLELHTACVEMKFFKLYII
jgi:hypothetical protein